MTVWARGRTRRIAGAIVITFATCSVQLPSSAQADEPRILRMANRADQIGDDTLAKFEAETGIKVQYDVYADDAALERKLADGHPGYDLVVMSAVPALARQIAAKHLRPIDSAKLQNYTNLDPAMLTLTGTVDPKNRYAVPYLWGMSGLGINVEKLKAAAPDAPLDSLDLLFDPAIVSRAAACGIAVPDLPQELIPAALLWLGRDPASRDEADLNQAIDAIDKVRGYFRRLHGPQRIDPLTHGQVCVAYEGIVDHALARSHADEPDPGLDIAYAVPRQGGLLWVDVLAIPADAADPEAALALIDFLLRPEIIGDITNRVETANPNMLSLDFVDEELKSDASVFPPDAIRSKLVLDPPVAPAYERARTKAWARLRAVK
ncbi:MAG TPA: extracellular solute-binding protein [Stellaceae bacterium]|nr:extracellular solute-binding protein [Stellaceae bacterium]